MTTEEPRQVHTRIGMVSVPAAVADRIEAMDSALRDIRDNEFSDLEPDNVMCTSSARERARQGLSFRGRISVKPQESQP